MEQYSAVVFCFCVISQFLYSFQAAPFYTLAYTCMYCEVAFDWFTCVYLLGCISLCCAIWLFLFSRLSFLRLLLSSSCSVVILFLSLFVFILLSLSLFLSLSLRLHFHLVDCHHWCCHVLALNITRLRWVTFFCHSLLLVCLVFYLIYKILVSWMWVKRIL